MLVRADPAVRRLLFCGVGCAVQALRSVEADLDLDELYVLGTNCADNSPTPEAARNFLRDGFLSVRKWKHVIISHTCTFAGNAI